MELVKIEEKRTREFYVYCLTEKKQIGPKCSKEEVKTLAAQHIRDTKHSVEIRKDLRTTVRYELV